MSGQLATAVKLDKLALEKLKAKVHPELIKTRQIRGGGKADYIPHQVFSRILTDALDFNWQWEVISDQIVEIPDKKGGGTQSYVKVFGCLTIPGVGSWTAFGLAKLEDEESWKKADTAAFRKACDRAGIAYQTWDDGSLYEEDFEGEIDEPPAETMVRAANPPATQTQERPSRYTEEQKTAMVKLKEYFGITNNVDLLKLVALWNPDYQGLPRPEDIDDFLAWARRKENVQRCKEVLAGKEEGFTKEQLEHLADIKEAYGIKTESELQKLIVAWNPNHSGPLKPSEADDFIAWVRANPDECDLALTM